MNQCRLAAWVLLMALTTPSFAASSWVYEARDSRLATIEISSELGRVVVGDRGYEASFCNASGIACFRSEALSFAVPASMNDTNSWHEGSLHYEIVGRRKFEFKGKNTQVLVIRLMSEPKARVALTFLYSPTHGLLAIASDQKRGAELLRLQGDCGFPQTQCK